MALINYRGNRLLIWHTKCKIRYYKAVAAVGIFCRVVCSCADAIKNRRTSTAVEAAGGVAGSTRSTRRKFRIQPDIFPRWHQSNHRRLLTDTAVVFRRRAQLVLTFNHRIPSVLCSPNFPYATSNSWSPRASCRVHNSSPNN